MIITDTLNGYTVEDVRRNKDGSVTLYTDNGRKLTLFVYRGRIEAMPPKLVLPGCEPPHVNPESQRMRLQEAFVGLMVDYATYTEDGCLNLTCQPLRGREKYSKSSGHREIRLTHSQGLIDELPAVSAVVSLPSLAVFGGAHGV